MSSLMLSPHFSMYEAVRNKHRLSNEPTAFQIERMVVLCVNVLEPWRLMVGPLKVDSFFRSPVVNELADGRPDSQHMKGEAADLDPQNLILTLRQCFDVLIQSDLPYDQAILYPSRGFIHVSHTLSTTRPNRRDARYSILKHKYPPYPGPKGDLHG